MDFRMKRILASLCALCLLGLGAGAQILPGMDPHTDSIAFARVRARMDSIRQYRPTVALVLSGGGARGLAHLGVIRLVEELGIPVDIVTGTSMGGLVAGLYSLGYNHLQLDSLVRSIDWPVMMSDKIPDAYVSYRLRKHRERFALRIPFHYDNDDLRDKKLREMSLQLERLAEESEPSTSDALDEAISRMGLGMPDGLLFGINIRNTVSSVSVGYQDSLYFSDLPIAFSCVATEMTSLRPKYWTEGSIVDAVRSTISIPFLFRAVRTKGEVLLDGGMRNNYPVDLAKEMGADIIIGSEMSNRLKIDELNNPVDLVLQTINLLGVGAMERAIKMPDLNVHHELKEYNMLSFDDNSVDNIIAEGYRNALESKAQFEALAGIVGGKTKVPRPATATNIALTRVKVGEIQFEGLTPEEEQHIIDKRYYPKDGLYGKKEIETLINYIYGTNAFESVTYRLDGRQEPYTLVFECQKGQVNELAIGVHADTDEYVYLAARLGIGTRRLTGFRFTGDLKLGGNPSLTLDAAFRPMVGIPTFGASLRGRLLNASYNNGSTDISTKLFNMAADAYLEDSRMTYGSMKAGVTFEMNPYEQYVSQFDSREGWDWDSGWFSAFANISVDTRDDGYFPTKGLKFTVDGRYVFGGYSRRIDYEGLGEHGEVPGYATAIAHFSTAISPIRGFTILPSVYLGWNSIEYGYMNPLHVTTVGGTVAGRYVEHQMPFFGFPSGYNYCDSLSDVVQLDLRYCFGRKNFVTARGGYYHGGDNFRNFFKNPILVWAAGAEYARQSVVGPIKIGAQWCNTVGFSLFASLGFDF